MKAGIKNFFRHYGVLTLGTVGAAVTACLVPPDRLYWEYIDWTTLGLLWCLFLICRAASELGLFSALAARLFSVVRTPRALGFTLVFLCFGSSMLWTNDVALVTFIPFALLTLNRAGLKRHIPFIVVLQTLAANLGCMFTPLGSPQNLFLASRVPFSFAKIMKLTAPYVWTSACLLALALVWKLPSGGKIETKDMPAPDLNWRRLSLYLVLFGLVLAVVGHLMPLSWLVVLTAGVVVFDDPSLLYRVDYALLATFAVFFVFVGNLERLPFLAALLADWTNRSVLFSAVLSSQVISNVPATLLLSGFTQNWSELLIGVNLGGLGTPVASMASLISYGRMAKAYPERPGKYLLTFTICNLLFLLLLLGLFYCLNHPIR